MKLGFEELGLWGLLSLKDFGVLGNLDKTKRESYDVSELLSWKGKCNVGVFELLSGTELEEILTKRS